MLFLQVHLVSLVYFFEKLTRYLLSLWSINCRIGTLFKLNRLFYAFRKALPIYNLLACMQHYLFGFTINCWMNLPILVKRYKGCVFARSSFLSSCAGAMPQGQLCISFIWCGYGDCWGCWSFRISTCDRCIEQKKPKPHLHIEYSSSLWSHWWKFRVESKVWC